MFGLFKKIFGTAQSRLLRRYEKLVRKINVAEEALQGLSDQAIKAKTAEFKERYAKGETLDDLLVEAYAVVKNACRRLVGTDIHVSGYDQKWDMIPYDVQILGAISMHHGAISEMQTGEGKTLTASMPLYLNALSGQAVHLITVNDYLAQRDCEWVGSIFRWLGLTVKALTNDTHERSEVYQADIVYGTASEFGFDYLRDNSMAQSADEQCQRGYFYAIIDEVDSILIDEARTPLIISGPTNESKQMYQELQEPVAAIVREQLHLCNRMASEARKTLETLGVFEESEEKKKLAKEDEKEASLGYRKLWLVSKGAPHNKILKRAKENPDIRAEIDKWDIYFHSETNKEEKLKSLAELDIIVDEKANEYELTDKGIQLWVDTQGPGSEGDFLMLDLGHEYAQIDQNEALEEQQKLEKKVALREEDSRRKEKSHNLRQMLRAHLLMERDIDYIVEEDKIVIIDENTGRPQPGRRFSNGLHQAIEAKEGVKIQGETQTYATITLQNYFRLYKKLAGMTGTAMTEANEFKDIYKLDVLAIPTHHKCIRNDEDDEIYMTEREKYNAIVVEVRKIHEQGRPILIGTESVEASEKLARILRQNKLPHTVLNAKNHAKEAEIIAEAGREGAITVATNMAGRGTDIKLKSGVAAKGGLHIIGTTRHSSRRIDRQLRGRSARQGDPGSSKFYISFEDTLMRLFTSPRITVFLQRFRPPEGEPIAAKVLNKSIETAQKRVEQRNFTMRKHTLEYDDVMNKHREEIYAFRNEVLKSPNPQPLAEEILETVCYEMATEYLNNPDGRTSDPLAYRNWLMTNFPVTFDLKEFDNDHLNVEQIERMVAAKVLEAYRHKIQHQMETIRSINDQVDPTAILAQVVRNLLIRIVDKLWQEHLLHIDHLRTEVSVRSIGNKDPLLEFKHEAFALFDRLSRSIKEEIAHALFRFQMTPPPEERPPSEKLISFPEQNKPKKKAKTKELPSPLIDLSLMD